MKRALSLLLAALALVLSGTPALAQASGYPAGHSGARVVAKVTWVEEWDPASQQWVRVEDSPASVAPAAYAAELHAPVASSTTVSVVGGATVTETVIEEPVRFIARPAALVAGMRSETRDDSQFGPFRVLDGKRAALVGATDVTSPAAFRAMMAAYPAGLEVIEFLDAPGTSNDIANLALGRAIRAAGLATHVPDGGSARSGAVELFLAGTRRTVDAGALFAVHSWRDALGREPDDFGPDAPENRLYLDYYAEMGMTADEARAFYAMTNSVPHERALWLRGSDMARWVAPDAAARARVIDAPLAGALRQALLRSGHVLADALKAAPWRAPATPVAAPRLAYADTGAGLLDSPTAFP
jgi:hypothetical protein